MQQSEGLGRDIASENYAWRLYRKLFGPTAPLPATFVCAHQIDPRNHLAMMRSVQPFIDAAISKTINLTEDFPFQRFKDLYFLAWRYRLKGLAVHRQSSTDGSVFLS